MAARQRHLIILFIFVTVLTFAFFTITNDSIWHVGLDKKSFKNIVVPGLDFSKLTINCGLNVNVEKDTTIPYAVVLFNGIQKLSNQAGVSWFLTGEAALRLTRTGGMYERNKMTQDTLIKAVDVCILADSKSKLNEFLRFLILETKSGAMQDFYCQTAKDGLDENQCSVIFSHDKALRARIITTWMVNKGNNSFVLGGNDYLITHELPLDRYLPVAHASYYGHKVPVPNDLVYAFSHMVPLKGSQEATAIRYQLGQGCGELFPEISTSLGIGTGKNTAKGQESNEYTKCGQYLHDHGFLSLYNECLKPQERFVPFGVLFNKLKNEKKSTLKFEDSRDVLLYHRGTGQYKLADPNKALWSQDGQDKYVDNLLQGKRDGFFLEMGALDGEYLSNSLFFEKMRGWDGLLIEAIPGFYDGIVSKDRKCNIMNACITDKDSHNIFDIVGALSGSNQLMGDGQKKRIGKNNKQVKVACKSLNDILSALNVTHIDYFSLDVEGAEIHILNHIDWNKRDIDIVGIETFFNRNEIINIMRSKGYTQIGKVAYDDFFRRIK